MNGIAQAIETVRTALSQSVAPQVFPDLCDIVSTSKTPDGSGGTRETPLTVASGVPCSYESLSVADRQMAGTIVSGLTHKIKLPSNAITQAIRNTYSIAVSARGNTPAMTFRRPVVLDDSTGPWVIVAASFAE